MPQSTRPAVKDKTVSAAYARLRTKILSETSTFNEGTRRVVLKALDELRDEVDDDPTWFERVLHNAGVHNDAFIDK